MRILWVTLESLLPLDTAGKKGVFRRLEQVCESNEVVLYYFYDKDEEIEKNKKLDELCVSTIPIKRNGIAKSLLYSLKFPYTVATRYNRSFISSINKTIQKYDFDIINIDFPQMAYFLKTIDLPSTIKVILNQHNVEWQRFEEMGKSLEVSLFKKSICKIESFRLRNYEQKMYSAKKISYYTFVSAKDLEYFHEWTKTSMTKLKLIPGGGEIKNEVSPIQHEGKNIVFVGVMSNEFNPEGAMWFINNVLPHIENVISNVRFYIVGKDPIQSLRNIKQKNIYVTGYVDNLDYYYAIADLIVIPVLHGGGVKLKLLEAVGYNKFIVSTSQGAKGTEFVDQNSIFIADDEKLFADYCIELLLNPDSHIDVLKRAENLFYSKYSWDAVGKEYKAFLTKIVDGDN